MVRKKEIICRYAGCDGYGNELLSEQKLENNRMVSKRNNLQFVH